MWPSAFTGRWRVEMEKPHATFLDDLRRSWSPASSSLWKPENPALGQCGVTALLAQDRFGGTILKTEVGGRRHFYNRIDGRRIDFTAEQFDRPIDYRDVPSTREEALSDSSDDQYRALSARLSAVEAKEQV